MRLCEDDDALALRSFFSFSLKFINIRVRASSYSAWRSAIVFRVLLVVLLLPMLPVSEGSTSESSPSSPATEPGWETMDFCFLIPSSARRMILNAG